MVEICTPQVDIPCTLCHFVLKTQQFTLVDKKQTAGSYKVEWDASGFATGVYLYRLSVIDPLRRTGEFVETKKLVKIK